MNTLLYRLFIKNYQDTKNPSVREGYGKLAGAVGIVSNTLLCVMKILVGFLSGSISILADGINNLADASSSVITLVGFKLASMPEDEEHPYGHARIEYIAGMVVSLIIILLGVQLLKTSIEKILNPALLEFSYSMVVVLLIAIVVKIWQAFFNIKTGKLIGSVTLAATGTDSRNDVIATSAVLLGLILGKLTGLQLDGWLGCLVALFILWSGIQLIRETSSPLLGEAPDPELIAAMMKCAEEYPAIIGIHDVVVHNYGPGRIFASIHAEVDADGNFLESHDMIDNLEKQLSQELHIHAVVHMDPVKTNDPLLAELREAVEHSLSGLSGVCGFHDLRIVPGTTHTNIIFDVVLDYDCKLKESEIRAIAEKDLRSLDATYCVVITFDKAYAKH